MFILGIAAVAALVVWTLPKPVPAIAKLAVSGVLLLVVGMFSFTTVEEGHEGVVLTFGAASDEPMMPGLHFKLPWQTVEELKIREEKSGEGTVFECSSKDLQLVDVEMTIIWRRRPGSTPAIWAHAGQDSETLHVLPGAMEALKSATARKDATSIVQEREQLSLDVRETLSTWLERFDLELLDCSIAETRFSKNYQTAIEEKKQAYEKVGQARNELEEARTRADIVVANATGEANGDIENARGQASAIRRTADAEAFELIQLANAEATRERETGRADAAYLANIGAAVSANPAAVALEAVRSWTKGGSQIPAYLIRPTDGAESPSLFLQLPAEPPAPVAPVEPVATETTEPQAEQ